MLRKRGKKRVYTLPRINPRAANLNSMDDAQKLGREIQDNVMEILDYAFNPIPEGEEDRIQVCYDGSDIPDDNTRRNCGTGDRKRNQAPTGQNNTVRVNIGQNSNTTHHTMNFDNREQHRTSALEDVQQRLTQIAQVNSSMNMENICPACPSDNPQNNKRCRNMAKRHQQSNGQDNNSSAASNSGTSTDWDGKCKNAQPADAKVKAQETAEPKRPMNSGAPGATEIITATTHADWLCADPAHPDTQVTTIHTLPHAQEMTIPYHQWNLILPPDPHPCLPAKEQETLNYHKSYKQSYGKTMRKQN